MCIILVSAVRSDTAVVVPHEESISEGTTIHGLHAISASSKMRSASKL